MAAGPKTEKTRTITGVPSHSNPVIARRHGYSSKIDVGHYLFQPKGPVKHARDLRRVLVRGVVCPYCRGPLTRLDPRDGRMSGRVISIRNQTTDNIDAILDPVPANQWVGDCHACRMAFSVPKSATRAKRPPAVGTVGTGPNEDAWSPAGDLQPSSQRGKDSSSSSSGSED